MVRQWQDMFFNKRYASTSLLNPNFVMIAETYNIPGRRVSKRRILKFIRRDALLQRGHFLLDLLLRRKETYSYG